MARTALSNEAEGLGAARVGVVSYVLCYDDLLSDNSLTLPLLGPDTKQLDLGRCESGPVRFEEGKLSTPDGYVSNEHARLRCQGMVDVVENLSTTKATFVNGAKITGVRVLRDGDLIEIGRSLFSYRSVAESAARRVVNSAAPLVLGLTVTRSPEAAGVVETIRRLAPSDMSLALFGEQGTGKEHIARQIHDSSARARGPYVAFNCGAVQGSLAESELFGHERGAFTGAVAQSAGLISSAAGGTLLLDEIGELAPSTQPVLLRAIEAREMRRVGSSKVQRVDVRWVAATNADISDERRFRPDLRSRIVGHEIHIPPLRERREDLGSLTAYLLRARGARATSIKKEAARLLFLHAFPGNIRELRNTLDAATLLAGDGPIDVQHLGPAYSPAASDGAPRSIEALPAHDRQKDPGRAALEAALKQAGNNRTRAAQAMNAHPRSFARWLEKHGLD